MGGEEPMERPSFLDLVDTLAKVTVICPGCHNANRRARRECNTCGGHGFVEKVVARNELPDEVEGRNCDVWAQVDFGKGRVEVRCTQKDEHDVHGVMIMFQE